MGWAVRGGEQIASGFQSPGAFLKDPEYYTNTPPIRIRAVDSGGRGGRHPHRGARVRARSSGCHHGDVPSPAAAPRKHLP